ncbi:MAG: type 2 isopentenyl-diphosphate Delta-isomerase [Asgard group archaeon]|nr:type 2 isopentenyl-diphosphate Delta-isomerase [Asgard group archaeon]
MTKRKPAEDTSTRKQDHSDICCNYTQEIEMSKVTGFEDIEFVHKALPEIDFEEIDTSTTFLKHKFEYPILISSITGGTEKAKKINKQLAQLVEKYGIGMGVGSQRVAIEDIKYKDSFTEIRKFAPNSFIASNLGAVQLNYDFSKEHVQEIIDMISANALILHLNPLQEAIQPEGDTNFKNLLPKIRKLGEEIKQPIIAKEVGAGISYEMAKQLIDNNVEAIEIAGAGGTSWAQIEAIRAKQHNAPIQSNVGKLFKDWGIPTAVSTIEIGKKLTSLEFISSGGIRNGLQAAKALAFGAKLVGVALPVACLASSATEKQLLDWLEQFIYELKTAMFLVGASRIEDLRKVQLVILGKTAQWLKARGIVSSSELFRG